MNRRVYEYKRAERMKLCRCLTSARCGTSAMVAHGMKLGYVPSRAGSARLDNYRNLKVRNMLQNTFSDIYIYKCFWGLDAFESLASCVIRK